MKTEIKNALFSLTTLRAPELSDATDNERRFVFRALNSGEHFDQALIIKPVGQSKVDAMLLACTSFKTQALQDENAVRSINQNLYDFSIWLARNRTNYDPVELDKWVALVVKITDGTASYKKLWDNLFYQVITQNNFYIKEAIMHVLVANNLLKYYVNDESILKDLMHAKVVLPKSLFVEDTVISSSLSNKSSAGTVSKTYPDVNMKNVQTISFNSQNISNYNALLKELKLVEKKYRNEYAVEYKIQKDVYDLRNKPLWVKYYADLELAKKNWCTLRDPKIPYDSNDPCDMPNYVPEPDVPEFVFVFTDEMDLIYLKDNLKETSFEVLMDVVGMSEEYNLAQKANLALKGNIEKLDTFDALNSEINNAIESSNSAISNASNIVTPTYISYGGVVVPVSTVSVFPFEATLCSKNLLGRKMNFDLSFEVPDSSWQVTHFECVLSYNAVNGVTAPSINGSAQGPFPIVPANNMIAIPSILVGGILVTALQNLKNLKLIITFVNGCLKTFTTTSVEVGSCSIGELEGDCLSIVTPSGPKDDTTLFIPSGHGFKQLGIADYKVVEQSIHCYVEGEVAHIENVMAREHRSKSTKKSIKKEDTFTEKSEQETEKISDTATTERFEMQSEVSKVLQENKAFNASTEFNVKGTAWDLSAAAGFATNSSKEQNTRQAITNAKEVVQKVTERLTNKVSEERIRKITEEFEETNIHEFDNRKGDKHVVGVYRWVDKVYKNQIVNYGKRLTFEFMIPEPARLHKIGMENANEFIPSSLLIEPVDPRKYDLQNTNLLTSFNLSNYSKVNDRTLQKWAGIYNVEGVKKLPNLITVGESFTILGNPIGSKLGNTESNSGNGKITIPEGYETIEAYGVFNASGENTTAGQNFLSLSIGNNTVWYSKQFGRYSLLLDSTIPIATPTDPSGLTSNNKLLRNYQGEIPVSFTLGNHVAGDVSASVKCQLTTEAKQKWQQDTFKAIIDGYEKELQLYKDKRTEEKEKAITNADTNPAFFRQMMNLVLRKNCISYLIDQTTTAKRTYGKNMSNGAAGFGSYEVRVDADLDDYGAFVKFIEQAFEWNIMSYHFYPYYWANRNEWQKMYQFNKSDDPLFRSFMQSGMARTIVTVRPGFEDAVRFYMQTGKIWNGGEVPVIEDKLYMSIIDELREPDGKKEGKAWATRVPSNLTILQANSIGLEVEKALPCNCDDLSDFENPEDVPCSDGFEMTNAQIGNITTGTAKIIGTIEGALGVIAKIELKDLEGDTLYATLSGIDGDYTLKQITPSNYELFIDSDNLFDQPDYSILSGSKQQLVTLSENQTFQANLKVLKL